MPTVDPRTAPTERIARGNPSLKPETTELTHRVARLVAGSKLGRLPTAVADRIIALIVDDLRTRPLAELDARLADAMEDAWALEVREDDVDMRHEAGPDDVVKPIRFPGMQLALQLGGAS